MPFAKVSQNEILTLYCKKRGMRLRDQSRIGLSCENNIRNYGSDTFQLFIKSDFMNEFLRIRYYKFEWLLLLLKFIGLIHTQPIFLPNAPFNKIFKIVV